jgi:crotonobetainyl-CoA:carnitine CoA-transferase CaiB-like acyl-CoA transferase
VDAALAEGAFSFIEPHVPAYGNLGEIAQRAGSGIAGSVPNNLYRSSDGQYVHIQAAQNTVFRRFAPAIGMPGLLEDERFDTAINRGRHQQQLDDIVSQWAGQHTVAEIRRVLDVADVPATGINNIADIFQDAHFRARGMLAEVADDDLGSVTLAAPVPKLSRTPGHIRKSGGRVGQDTRSVLLEMGFTAAELQVLEDEAVVYCDSTPVVSA